MFSLAVHLFIRGVWADVVISLQMRLQLRILSYGGTRRSQAGYLLVPRLSGSCLRLWSTISSPCCATVSSSRWPSCSCGPMPPLSSTSELLGFLKFKWNWTHPGTEPALMILPWHGQNFTSSLILRCCWFSGPRQTSLRWKSLRMWLLMLHCSWDMRSTGALLLWGRLGMAVIWRNS